MVEGEEGGEGKKTSEAADTNTASTEFMAGCSEVQELMWRR